MYQARDEARRAAVKTALSRRPSQLANQLAHEFLTEAFDRLVADQCRANLIRFYFMWEAVSRMCDGPGAALDAEQGEIYQQLLATFDAHTI